jgi:hypothetical protein
VERSDIGRLGCCLGTGGGSCDCGHCTAAMAVRGDDARIMARASVPPTMTSGGLSTQLARLERPPRA